MNPEEYAQLFRLGESHWWFVGTRDILFSSLRRKDLRMGRILDAGCGSGLMMRRFHHAGAVYGIDNNLGALRHCAGLGFTRLCQGDTLRAPFKSDSFDLVIAADLLEHCEDDEQALSEFYRVTAHGGCLLMSVPAHQALWSSHDVSLHHQRRYSKKELVRKALDTGYSVERASYFNTILFPPIALARLTLGKLPKRDSNIRYYENMRLLNRMLLGLMRVERNLLSRCDLPFGLSILLIASKQ